MKEVEVEALRPFNRTPQGDMVHPGDEPFHVDEFRAGELKRAGLARTTGKTRTAAARVPIDDVGPIVSPSAFYKEAEAKLAARPVTGKASSKTTDDAPTDLRGRGRKRQG